MNETPGTYRATAVNAQSSVSWASSDILGVVGFVVLMSIGAQVRIPVPGTDVPMTLQSLVALLAGFAMSPTRAGAAMLAYLGCGVVGLPVFAPGSAGLAGPTGGFLVGFVAAGCLVSVVKGGRHSGLLRLLIAGSLGTAAIFVSGVAWRTLWFDGSVVAALRTGLMPFMAKAVVQLGIAVMLVRSIGGPRRRLGW